MNKNIHDPRELLAEKLNRAGIDMQKSFLIALDAGRNLVDKVYLLDLGLRGRSLKTAERLVQKFYWENNAE